MTKELLIDTAIKIYCARLPKWNKQDMAIDTDSDRATQAIVEANILIKELTK